MDESTIRVSTLREGSWRDYKAVCIDFAHRGGSPFNALHDERDLGLANEELAPGEAAGSVNSN